MDSTAGRWRHDHRVGLSILSGNDSALTPGGSLLASVLVDSLSQTEQQLISTGWTLAGSLGTPGSLLAVDADGSLFEFVEAPREEP